MTQIILTGASGYLGSAIAERLVRKNIDFSPIFRSGTTGTICDLLNALEVSELIDRHRDACVIHCAARVPDSAALYQDKSIANDNLSMVRNLAAARPARLIFASSMTVYPNNVGFAKVALARSEGSGYSASKVEAEKILLSQKAIKSTILRIPGLFGPPRQSGVLFNSAIRLARGEQPMLSAQMPQWAALHVDDAAEIFVRAATTPLERSTVLNAGYPGPMSVALAVRYIASRFGTKLDLPDGPEFCFDLDGLDRELGPIAGSLEHRLNDLVDWAMALSGNFA